MKAMIRRWPKTRAPMSGHVAVEAWPWAPVKPPTAFWPLDFMEWVDAVKPRQHWFVKIVLNRDQAMRLGAEASLWMFDHGVATGAELGVGWGAGTGTSSSSSSFS